MKINMETKKQEALKRLEILKHFGMSFTAPIRQFKNEDEIGIFENQGSFADAVYYGLNMNTGDEGFYDNLKAAVTEFENGGENKVYLILVTHTVMGTLCDFFYVGDNEKSWSREKARLAKGIQQIYCYNMDEPLYSEFGDIGFVPSPAYGGIKREY